MQRLILAEACFFAQFGWTLLILCRCSAAPNSLDSPLKSLILYALALILHALYPVAPSLKVLPESLGGSLTAHRLTPMLAWLDLGGDVNATDAKGRTLLHFASATGLEDAVCELMRRGADVNARQQRGNTPLTFATMNSHRAVLRLLLMARANANLADDKGLTPLMWAARRGSTTMVKLLLEGGAQTALRDSTGLTVMGHAKSHSCAAVEKRIGLLLRQHLRTSVPQQQDQEVAEEQQEAGSRDSRGKEQQHDQYV